MRTRTNLVTFVAISLVASAVALMAVTGATTGTAHACSIAGPYAEVWPSSGLHPGQKIDIVGRGFSDIIATDEPSIGVPPDLCDFDIVARVGVEIVWRGETMQQLAVVDGPDFFVAVTVPEGVAPGTAIVDVGGVPIEVFVGDELPPPPTPYPPPPQPCLDWPAATQAVPEPLPPCPHPCPVYLDEWAMPVHCPDPCGVVGSDGVWCPEPCYLVGGDALVCPDPGPVPLPLPEPEPRPQLVPLPELLQIELSHQLMRSLQSMLASLFG